MIEKDQVERILGRLREVEDRLAEPATAIRFAVAASALKHTFSGDYNYATRTEVESLMKGSASGRVQR